MATNFETVEIETTEHCVELAESCPADASPARRGPAGLRHAWQRGMATAEYAVGILAAVALALVLLKIFNNNEFFTTLLSLCISLIGKVGMMIG